MFRTIHKGGLYKGFWWGNVRERGRLEDPGLGGRIILKMYFQEVGCGDKDWIDLAEDRGRCRVLVSAVINHRVS
jgi:hypothetical protein